MTLFTGLNLIELPGVDSTNNYARKLIADSKAYEGTVVWAIEQTQGRGQRGKEWSSASGKNLTFSIIYRPAFLAVTWQFLLSQVVSLGIVDALSGYFEENDPIKIKWPNDIYCGDKKLAGILIENSVQQAVLATSIIGIGLNVNQTGFPSELPNPTSLQLELRQEFELKEILLSICAGIEARYLQLKAGNITDIQSEYKQKLYRLNQRCKFTHSDSEINATIIGTTEDGKLLLNDVFGNTNAYSLNEVSMIIRG